MNRSLRVTLFEITIGILGLVLTRCGEHGQRDKEGEFDLQSAVIGFLEEITYFYVKEHEPVASRLQTLTDRLALVVLGGVRSLFVNQFVSSGYSRGLGQYAGIIVYRCWYGLVRDLPDARLRKWGRI